MTLPAVSLMAHFEAPVFLNNQRWYPGSSRHVIPTGLLGVGFPGYLSPQFSKQGISAISAETGPHEKAKAATFFVVALIGNSVYVGFSRPKERTFGSAIAISALGVENLKTLARRS